MIIFGRANPLTINVTGYEYEAPVSEWDDWLIVEIDYSVEGRSIFHFSDPCLMTTELKSFAKILREFATSKEKKKVVEFLEPIIEFTLKKEKYEHYDYYITAEINMEAYKDNDIIVKTKACNPKEYEKLIESVEEMCKKFPPR
ncbi:MAG: hypothetical protein ACI4KG_05385 [Oscillospiraceae bacterium]